MTTVQLPRSRVPRALAALVPLHLFIIVVSNYLVQIPVSMFGLHSTWAAFSYPFIFLATDLTVRLIGAHSARRVIARVMLPALVASYVVSVLFEHGRFNGFAALLQFDSFVFRIALASFCAYVLGQLLDIKVFNRIRHSQTSWWMAPAASSIFGQALDTLTFFSIAFWHSSNQFMAENWVGIGLLDYAIKLTVSLVFFVPVYGVALRGIMQAFRRNHICNAPTV